MLISTGQGLLGNNMFAYCLNNPVCRKDILGAVSANCFNPEDVDHTDNNKEIDGGKMGNGDPGNATKRIGGGHGNAIHSERIENHMDNLEQSGDYSTIYGNRSLKTAGLEGNQRPDVIAIRNDGRVEVWEFASPSQAFGTAGYYALQMKIDIMAAANPSATFYAIINW